MDRSSRCCPTLNNWYRYNYTQSVPPSETKPNVCLPLHYTISWHGEHRLNFCVDTDDFNSPMMIVPLLIVGPSGADDDEFPYKEWATMISSLLENGRTSGDLQNCCMLGRYIAIMQVRIVPIDGPIEWLVIRKAGSILPRNWPAHHQLTVILLTCVLNGSVQNIRILNWKWKYHTSYDRLPSHSV
jgi:hypothetical protein